MLDKNYASQIGTVHVDFELSSPSLDPSVVTATLGILPDRSWNLGEEPLTANGKAKLAPREDGLWVLSSENKIQGDESVVKDINDHLHYLLDRLLPYQKPIQEFAKDGDIFFDVLWTSRRLFAGDGPQISKQCLAGIAALGADIGFDIYPIDDSDVDDSDDSTEDSG